MSALGDLSFLAPYGMLIVVGFLPNEVWRVLGLVLAPLLAWRGVDLDVMWTGLIGGAVGYAAQRTHEALR